MTDHRRLLADYAENGSEPAFRDLVEHYLGLVYSTALRVLGGDAYLAQDAAQMVFLDLARKARTLPRDVMLGGWLHRHTCFVAAKIARGERRRRLREKQAVAMNELQDHSEANLALVAPVLDEAINQLGAEDRAAILLRFFEQRDLRSIGEALGSTENAAQKRVSRALDELRVLLKNRGVALSAAALGTMLAGSDITAAPAGLGAIISNGALAGAAAGAGITLNFLKLMTTTNLKLGLGALVAAGVITALVMQRGVQDKLREENESLRQEITQIRSINENLSKRLATARPTPRLPAPQMLAVAPPVETPGAAAEPANFYLQLRKDGKVPKLTAKQIDTYLAANRHSAASLLAAFRALDDPALLREAMRQYPNDPQVDFAAAVNAGLSPEDKRQWLDAFEKSAPNNALANYLSANNYFDLGRPDQAVQELAAAADKPGMQDYTANVVQNVREAYVAAGYPDADAEAIALMQPPNPNLVGLKQLAANMVNLASSYQQTGDAASAQATLQMVVNLGQQSFGLGEQTTVGQIMGLNIERAAFAAMDPNSSYGNEGQTVQDQAAALAQQRDAVMQLGQRFQDVQPMMTTQDWSSYTDRLMIFGQQAAEQWAVAKYGQ